MENILEYITTAVERLAQRVDPAELILHGTAIFFLGLFIACVFLGIMIVTNGFDRKDKPGIIHSHPSPWYVLLVLSFATMLIGGLQLVTSFVIVAILANTIFGICSSVVLVCAVVDIVKTCYDVVLDFTRY